jgi:membrane-bound lytic murein transglycosylase B
LTATSRAAALAAVLILGGCGLTDRAVPPTPELGYPPAPRQVLPDAVLDADASDETPLADLADPAWLRETAERTGIQRRTLAAYAGAALRVAQAEPGCGLGWNTLAGIGAVESVHGTYLGARVRADGAVLPQIIGIPLDGREGVKAIPDSDGGELDGDTEWDRAVGPMQFIPTTWAAYAQDGNLDGRADPHQIDDAALTAARYLCDPGAELVDELVDASGGDITAADFGDLTTDDGWRTALTAYNRSVSYARDVAGHAEAYEG